MYATSNIIVPGCCQAIVLIIVIEGKERERIGEGGIELISKVLVLWFMDRTHSKYVSCGSSKD